MLTANVPLGQSYGTHIHTQQTLLSILEGLAQFESDGVSLPAGLREAVLAKDFDFYHCLYMFGLKGTLKEASYLLPQKRKDVELVERLEGTGYLLTAKRQRTYMYI